MATGKRGTDFDEHIEHSRFSPDPIIMVKFGATALTGLLILYGIMSLAFSVTPSAGIEAVLTDHPIIWGKGGVESEPVKAGRTFKLPWTASTLVDMRPQQKVEHFDDLMSKDGVPLDFDAAIRLQVTDSVGLITRLGESWYDENIAVEFRNRVRQAVRKHGMNETAIETTAIDAIDQEVTEAMSTYLKSANIPVQLIQITVGKANPPDAIKHQRIQTAEQQQRKLTETERSNAEITRKTAEENRAKADNAYRDAMSLSPAQFIELQRIKMLGETCKDSPCTFVVTSDQSNILVNGGNRPSAKAAAPTEQPKQ